MKWRLLVILILVLLLAPAMLYAPVGVECGVENSYDRQVGVTFDSPLGTGAVVESRTARVVTPSQAVRAGLTGAQAGDRETPRELSGTVTDPAVLKRLGFAAPKAGDRVVLELDGATATYLRLPATGERHEVNLPSAPRSK